MSSGRWMLETAPGQIGMLAAASCPASFLSSAGTDVKVALSTFIAIGISFDASKIAAYLHVAVTLLRVVEELQMRHWLPTACCLVCTAALACAAVPKLPDQYHATVVLTRQAVDDTLDLPLWEESGVLNLCHFWQAPV